MKKYSPYNFESFLKDNADQYLVYPSDHVWHKIDKTLRPKKYLAPLVVALIMISLSGGLVVMNIKEQKQVPVKTGQIAYTFFEKEPIKEKYGKLENIKIIGKSSLKNKFSPITTLSTHVRSDVGALGIDNQTITEAFTGSDKIELPLSIANSIDPKSRTLNTALLTGKKNLLMSTFELVLSKAKTIGKNAQWQFYITPSLSYRRLEGKATASTYLFTSYPYSTNSIFARDVNDAVKQNPDIGIELGSSMVYPLTKKLSLKTGLQLNYNHYQIEAYSGVPVLATYGMNNFGFGGRTAINTISIYNSTEGYRKANLKNEHIILSMPIGFEYLVIGNKNLNLSIASSVQPSYLIGNNAYLISTNLKNYAKEPSLNRKWNINTSIEASINFQSGSFRWSIAPQYRYQLLSSFKNKYPIKENLYDMGLKFGVIKTIR